MKTDLQQQQKKINNLLSMNKILEKPSLIKYEKQKLFSKKILWENKQDKTELNENLKTELKSNVNLYIYIYIINKIKTSILILCVINMFFYHYRIRIFTMILNLSFFLSSNDSNK
jgi:hypothetical protein